MDFVKVASTIQIPGTRQSAVAPADLGLLKGAIALFALNNIGSAIETVEFVYAVESSITDATLPTLTFVLRLKAGATLEEHKRLIYNLCSGVCTTTSGNRYDMCKPHEPVVRDKQMLIWVESARWVNFMGIEYSLESRPTRHIKYTIPNVGVTDACEVMKSILCAVGLR